MDTADILTLRLAETIGIFLIAAGAGGLIAPDRWRAVLGDMERSPGLILAFAIIDFALGATILLVHCSFADPLAGVVTVIGLAGAVEGLLLFVFPQALLAFSRPILDAGRLWAVLALAFGAALLLLGLTGHAHAL